MKSLSAALALLVPAAHAGLRFPCAGLTTQRLDPLVEPGANPSAHLHAIVGGNAFNVTMQGDVGERGTCTTCQMAEDFSNYWTAVLYFKHPTNGSYHKVSSSPAVPLFTTASDSKGGNPVGGLTIYYTQFDLSKDNIASQPVTAFKPGFRMTVGNPTASTRTHIGLAYQCLDASGNRGSLLPDFPTSACPGGIFTSHHFPACWDGKNLDSPNHQDHMYNTVNSDYFNNAPACPSTHPVRMPQVTFEITWATNQFNSMWTKGQPNPFVWSFEGTGGGIHGDYMFGWKGDSLQRAMNKSECRYDGCGSIKKQDMNVANKCTVKDFVGENFDGWLTHLPGY